MSQKISKYLVDYIEEHGLYLKVLATTLAISENQGGIKTSGRGVRAMKIFTRQTLTGMSLTSILPNPTTSKSSGYLWDICSIASLTRNLIEGYLSLYYFGIEIISESEADLRFHLLQLHKNVEWYNIRKLEMDDVEQKQFKDGIAEQKNKLKSHSFLGHLSNDQKKRVNQGAEMYKTKFDFEIELTTCKDLKVQYRLLSNLVHPLPLSIERVDNIRGRGLGTNPDVGYCLMCLALARKYLAATTIGIADFFSKEIGENFKNDLDMIRSLQLVGFVG